MTKLVCLPLGLAIPMTCYAGVSPGSGQPVVIPPAPVVVPVAPMVLVPVPGAKPPPPRNRDGKGLDSWYAGAGLGYQIIEEQRQEPGGDVEIGDAKYALTTHAFLGWGPVRVEQFGFNTHYKYSQSWGTDGGQIQRFMAQWAGNPVAETFIFPTKSLIRTHEIAADFRFIDALGKSGLSYTLGVFGRIELKRQGSKVLGDENETAENVRAAESAVPYITVQYAKTFRTQLWMPFFTEINKEDSSLSYSTYSWSSVGRGRIFSFVMNNELLLPRLQSRLLLDVYYYRYKYASLTADFDRPGGLMSFDFPLFEGLRLAPMASYNIDQYYLPKVRIPAFKKGSWNESNAPSEEFKRSDVNYSVGGMAYADLGAKKSHRIYFEFEQTQVISSIKEYNASKTNWSFGYSWALPGVSATERRINRFREGVYADNF